MQYFLTLLLTGNTCTHNYQHFLHKYICFTLFHLKHWLEGIECRKLAIMCVTSISTRNIKLFHFELLYHLIYP